MGCEKVRDTGMVEDEGGISTALEVLVGMVDGSI
jgi:hypothetical protein